MHELPHAFPTWQIRQHCEAGMHAFGASFPACAAAGPTSATNAATTPTITTPRRTATRIAIS
jgi:hypothetical protein